MINKTPKKYYMKSKCIICNKPCSTTSERCRSCQDIKHSKDMKGENNPFYGKSHNKDSIDLIIKGTKKWHKNNKNPFENKKHTKLSKKLIGEKALGRIMSEDQKHKISESMKGVHSGSKNPMFGRSGKKSPTFGRIMYIPNKVSYNNISMRSTWEVNFAMWLDLSNIKWKYEPKTFDLVDCTYTPDFYLPEFDSYIEIKGYFTDYARNKINKFKKLYNNVNFKLYKEKELKQLGVI